LRSQNSGTSFDTPITAPLADALGFLFAATVANFRKSDDPGAQIFRQDQRATPAFDCAKLTRFDRGIEGSSTTSRDNARLGNGKGKR
jgi:hypothetical protein